MTIVGKSIMKDFRELQRISLFLLALGLFLGVDAQQQCVPPVVPNLTYYNYSLYWTPLTWSPCDIQNYVIYVHDVEQGTTFHYQTPFNNVSADSFNLIDLEMCKNYTFEVHALTFDNVIGPSQKVVATTEPAAYLNLNIAGIFATVQENQINLKWNLQEDRQSRCISYYRVVHWDEDNVPKDVYVHGTNFTLKGEVPCMRYTFQVNAMVLNPDVQGPLSEVVTTGYAEVPNPPKLVKLVPGSRSVNMTWEVQPFSENRCELWGLTAHILGHTPNYVPIMDNSSRSKVNVTVYNLIPNNVYTGRVYLTNEIGVSKNVTLTFQTNNV